MWYNEFGVKNMLVKNAENRGQVEFVSLEEMVPKDHLLRKIDAAVLRERPCHSKRGESRAALAVDGGGALAGGRAPYAAGALRAIVSCAGTLFG